jgi:hypothetical protein
LVLLISVVLSASFIPVLAVFIAAYNAAELAVHKFVGVAPQFSSCSVTVFFVYVGDFRLSIVVVICEFDNAVVQELALVSSSLFSNQRVAFLLATLSILSLQSSGILLITLAALPIPTHQPAGRIGSV